jgi:hypothetical protein
MKNAKRIVALIMAVATLGSLSGIASSAITIKDADASNTYSNYEQILAYYEQNALTEAVLILEGSEEDDGTYYWLGTGEPSIDLSVFSDEELTTIKKHFPVKIDDSVDVSAVETVRTVTREDSSIPIDIGYCYTSMGYVFDELGAWTQDESAIQKATIGDSDEDSEATIGDSTTSVSLNETPTNVRGDVNYDGVVNAVDLLLLKKYLLKLITW